MRKGKKVHIWIPVTLLLVLAIIALAFFFSSQSAQESSRTSSMVARWILTITDPEFSRLTAQQQTKRISEAQYTIRKLAHFSEFCALGFFLTLHLRVVNFYYPKVALHAWLRALLIGIVAATADEIHQFFSEARAPAVTDVLIDTSGVVCGILMVYVLWQSVTAVRRRNRKKRDEVGN